MSNAPAVQGTSIRAARLRRWILQLTLILAAVHCAKSIFFANQITPAMRLDLYEAGTADNPYQCRWLMVPVLRWAHGNSVLQHFAEWQNHVSRPWELFTPEKALCLLIACLLLPACLLLLGGEHERRGGRLWWLPSVLLLEVLFVSFAARSNLANWYPYDFPNLLFCSIAAVALLRRRWWVLAVLMPVATLNRETAMFFAVFWAAIVLPEQRRSTTLWQSGVLVALWAAVYVPLRVHYAANGLEVQGQRVMNLHALLLPWQWPQLFSALGYLPLVVLLFRDRVPSEGRRLLLAMVLCSLPILWRGVWVESRIFLDYAPLLVLIVTEMVERGLVLAPLALQPTPAA